MVTRTRAIIAVVLFALISPLVLRAFRHTAHVHVDTATATEGAIVRRIIATGTLEATTNVQVGAQVSGTIESLGADYNSIVHKGQPIARLDRGLFEAALAQAEAALRQAQASEEQARAAHGGYETALTDARTKLVRAEELGAKLLIPQSDLDAARIAFDEASADLQSSVSQIAVAHASVQQAQAAVAQAAVNLDHTTITSPLDGIVVARSVDVGQTVASAVQAPVLFNIAADLTHMQVEVDIDESDIAGISPGQLVSFEVEAYPSQTFTGVVSSVRLQPVTEQATTATAAGPSAGTPATSVATVIAYATMVDVPNPDERLRPGMTATVTLAGARRDQAVRIPSTALSFRPPPEVLAAIGQAAPPAAAASAVDATLRQVWRFDGTQFTPSSVRVGLADDRWTELVSGPVRAGDSLVTSATVQ